MSSLPFVEMQDEDAPAVLRILSSIALKPLFERMGPQLEQAAGMRTAVTLLASPAVQREVRRQAVFDVAISNPAIVDEMIDDCYLVASTRVNIARSTIGVVGRAGVPKCDVGSMKGFRRALFSARSIAHSDGGVGRIFLRMLDDMGIRAELEDKLKVVPAFSGAEVVARGQADVAVLITVAVAGVEGVELIGIPPAELLPYVSFAGAVGASAHNPKAAAAFLAVLAASENDPALKAVGMSRIPN